MKAIESITEITKAMEMISAFRFKKAENRFSRTRGYFSEMEKLVSNLAAALNLGDSSADVPAHPLFEQRPIQRKALVVMTGDKGLCGAYNTNLLRTAQSWMRDNQAFQPAIIPVAKVGYEFFRKRHVDFPAAYPEKATADLALAKRITADLKGLFLSGKMDSVEVLYTTFRVGGTGRNRIEPFLGLGYLASHQSGGGQALHQSSGGQALHQSSGGQALDYIYEPDIQSVFVPLLTSYLEGKLYALLLESLTSEYAARMVAMKQATENGEEVLDSLKLLRNKTRQATITRELSEIVSGASVLV